MQELQTKIESLLFLEPKPLTYKKLAKVCGAKVSEVEEAVKALQATYEERAGGVAIVREGSNVQLMTAQTNAEFINEYLKEEGTGELTRPALETLTIIAYRGPVAKSEIELIRGVNCSLILRNLLIRGLAEEVGETDAGSPIYRVTLDFLRFLGVNSTSDLPDYEELNQNVHLQELLEGQADKDDFFAGDLAATADKTKATADTNTSTDKEAAADKEPSTE